MTTKKMVELLQELNHTVVVYQRRDRQGRKRGLIIRRIDGVYYDGSDGNKKAREMLATDLSTLQDNQMNKLNQNNIKTKVKPLPENVEKRLRYIQGLYRKAGIESPTADKYRNVWKRYGKVQADRSLDELEAFIKEKLKNV